MSNAVLVMEAQASRRNNKVRDALKDPRCICFGIADAPRVVRVKATAATVAKVLRLKLHQPEA